MDTFDLTISIFFIIAVGGILYLVLRDPVYMFKSLLRGLKTDGNGKAKILFFPVWAPVWLIDKVFGLKLYINEFEEASQPVHVSFSEYDKYIIINTTGFKNIESVLHAFENDYDPVAFNYRLNNSKINISELNGTLILKLGDEIDFNSFNNLVHYLDNAAPPGKVYNVKGILIHKNKRSHSYFIFNDPAFPIKLIGKTYTNKKIYVDINPGGELNDTIYQNSNMDYFKNFDFDKFENETYRLKFNELNLRPGITEYL
ncbi:hypothetical protein D1164_09075 [Mariniphaga sediminis]|uniref:Uncharacterized protein n=1 Tax=Mariniphaga sediminis TaxID=1628158 RepID=A0A399D2W7_9BACT|nr:hypothetical protein [Mariniphaga sediminis]RIH65793.1 hypothetical protein D1164_09075 [Mariniphaga sediminis]